MRKSLVESIKPKPGLEEEVKDEEKFKSFKGNDRNNTTDGNDNLEFDSRIKPTDMDESKDTIEVRH